MDNFKAVYKILSELEKQMDSPAPDLARFDHEALKISEVRWTRYIEMMYDCGYIKGVEISEFVGDDIPFFDCSDIRITLKGLEYLQENAIMRKLYKTAKGIKDIVPGA